MVAAEWRSFEAECAHCGAGAEVLTTTGRDNCAYDSDIARCTECGCPGYVSILDPWDDEVVAEIEWHDEPNCDCGWCQTHPPEPRGAPKTGGAK